MKRSLLAVLTAAFLVVTLLASGAVAAPKPTKGKKPPVVTVPEAQPPMDYIAQGPALSQPNYPNIKTEVVKIPAFDGKQLYLEITKPDAAEYGNGPWPVILEASPYHGT